MSVKVMRNEENFSSIDGTSAIGRFRVADFWNETLLVNIYLKHKPVHLYTGRAEDSEYAGPGRPGGHGGVLVFFCRNPGHFLGSHPGP